MAIYFNDKILTPDKNGNELEKRYAEELEEVDKILEQHNGRLFLNRQVTRIWDTEKKSFRPTPPVDLPTVMPIYLDSLGAVSIRYSKTPPERKGESVTFSGNRLFVYENMLLTKKEKDLAWFILKATNFVKSETNKSSSAFLRIEDPKKEVEQKASEVKRIVKVDQLLMNEDSPVYNKESLQYIADKFGVDIKGHDLESAGFLIRETVINGEKGKNPDVNIDRLLSLVAKLSNNMVDARKYSKEELDSMPKDVINELSKKRGLPYPPKCTREAQTEKLIESFNQ